MLPKARYLALSIITAIIIQKTFKHYFFSWNGREVHCALVICLRSKTCKSLCFEFSPKLNLSQIRHKEKRRRIGSCRKTVVRFLKREYKGKILSHWRKRLQLIHYGGMNHQCYCTQEKEEQEKINHRTAAVSNVYVLDLDYYEWMDFFCDLKANYPSECKF